MGGIPLKKKIELQLHFLLNLGGFIHEIIMVKQCNPNLLHIVFSNPLNVVCTNINHKHVPEFVKIMEYAANCGNSKVYSGIFKVF
jgi:hypothetical protein